MAHLKWCTNNPVVFGNTWNPYFHNQLCRVESSVRQVHSRDDGLRHRRRFGWEAIREAENHSATHQPQSRVWSWLLLLLLWRTNLNLVSCCFCCCYVVVAQQHLVSETWKELSKCFSKGNNWPIKDLLKKLRNLSIVWFARLVLDSFSVRLLSRLVLWL